MKKKMSKFQRINHRGKRALELRDVFAKDTKGGWKYRIYSWWFMEDICIYKLREEHTKWKMKYDNLNMRFKKLLIDVHNDEGVMELPIDKRTLRD